MAAHALLPPVATELHGLSKQRARDLVQDEIVSLLQPGQEDALKTKLDELAHNVKFIAGPLLREIYTETNITANLPVREAVLHDILSRELPQEEVLYFLWRCLTEKDCDIEFLRVVCEEKPDLLRLHLDFHHRFSPHSNSDVVGFPLSCVAQRFLPSDEDECELRMTLLLQHGAEVDSAWKDESTVVHLAASQSSWKIVSLLLNHQANIDVRSSITKETARKIIARVKPELVSTYPRREPAAVSITKRLYDAMYAGNETELVKILRDNKVDVNVHDGRATLLQMAVKEGMSKFTRELIDRGADLNIMAGLCTEPVLLAMDHCNLKCLGHISGKQSSLNLRFSSDSGTFLNALALRCTRKENVAQHYVAFHALIEEAVRQKVHISAKDKFGTTALEVLGFGSHECQTLFHLLLDHGGFLSLDETLVLNTRPDIFTSFFDRHLSFVEEYKRGTSTVPWKNRSESLEACYRFLEPLECGATETRAGEMLPFFEICKSREHRQVLLHPLVTLFLVYKWRKIAFIYIANFILYAAFTISYSAQVYLLTVASASKANKDDPRLQDYEKAYPYVMTLSLFFWSLLFFRELFQVYISPHYYVRNFENLLEIFLLLFSFLSFLPEVQDTEFVVATAIALTYVELTLLIGRHPYTGTYITMFTTVSAKSMELLFMFSSFIFAFAFAFFVFFYEFSSEHNVFRDLWHSIVRTSAMTVGELGLDSIKFSSGYSELAFIAFLVFVPVVLMNLLNALAVSDTQRVIDEASLLCCVANIKHYTKIEAMWLGYTVEQSPPGERCYGFVTKKTRCLSKLRSLFTVNVLPFPENPYRNPEPTHTLKIDLYQRHYYPHPYFWYVAPTATANYEIIRTPQTLCQMIQFFYYRILLRGNEDSAVAACRGRKYPLRTTDLHECMSTLRRNLQIDLELRQDAMQEALNRIMERTQIAHTSAMAVLEENLKTKLRNQSLGTIDSLTKALAIHDSILTDIQAQQNALSNELGEIKSTLGQIVTNLAMLQAPAAQ